MAAFLTLIKELAHTDLPNCTFLFDIKVALSLCGGPITGQALPMTHQSHLLWLIQLNNAPSE